MKTLLRAMGLLIALLPALAMAYQEATVREDAALLKKPEAKAKVLAQLTRNERVELLQCGRNWCLVRNGKRSGWIVRSRLWLHDPSAGTGVDAAGAVGGARSSGGMPSMLPGGAAKP